jgi:hypothetical protein
MAALESQTVHCTPPRPPDVLSCDHCLARRDSRLASWRAAVQLPCGVSPCFVTVVKFANGRPQVALLLFCGPVWWPLWWPFPLSLQPKITTPVPQGVRSRTLLCKNNHTAGWGLQLPSPFPPRSAFLCLLAGFLFAFASLSLALPAPPPRPVSPCTTTCVTCNATMSGRGAVCQRADRAAPPATPAHRHVLRRVSRPHMYAVY